MSESTISFPSLLILAGLSFVLYRFFFAGQGGSPAGRGVGRRIDPAAVEQVAGMFPQLDRRAIAWDLQRNGGNASATVERMLTTGRLETPPPSFQPPGLATAAPQTGAARPGSTAASTAKASIHPDLITRYNLTSRLAPSEETEEETEVARSAAAKGKGKATGWSANKNERANIIQKRKEEMILQARRKMEEKDRREAKGKGPEKVQQ